MARICQSHFLVRALRLVCRLATLHADGVSLGNVFGDGEKLWHRLPGFAGVVLIEAGYYDAPSPTRQLCGNLHQVVVKKLALIDSNHLRVRLNFSEYFLGATNIGRLMPHLGMRNDVVLRKARVNLRLKDLYFLTRNLRPP